VSDISTVWPILHYGDPERALRFLLALGFDAVVVGRDADDDIAHVELRWPGGGAGGFGATKHTEGTHAGLPPGSAAMYVVADDIEQVHERARVAGADVIDAPHETTFGSGARSHVFTVRDPEGHLWTFGTHRGGHVR